MQDYKGSYILLIALDRDTPITIGKLGPFSFPGGFYLYSGSALGGLKTRINRHLREDKKAHWHIDYLLMHSRIAEVWYILAEERLECIIAKAICALPQTRIPAPGFGSSDCRCKSHLFYLPRRPSLASFNAKLQQLSDYRLDSGLFSSPDAH